MESSYQNPRPTFRLVEDLLVSRALPSRLRAYDLYPRPRLPPVDQTLQLLRVVCSPRRACSPPRVVHKAFAPSLHGRHAARLHRIVAPTFGLSLLRWMPASWRLVLILAATAIMALAQRYEGGPVAHVLPARACASIEFFRIVDAQGLNSSLIVRHASCPTRSVPRADPRRTTSRSSRATVKRLVIVNTAYDGRPDYHFRAARDARNLAAAVNADVQRASAPVFVPVWVDFLGAVSVPCASVGARVGRR